MKNTTIVVFVAACLLLLMVNRRQKGPAASEQGGGQTDSSGLQVPEIHVPPAATVPVAPPHRELPPTFAAYLERLPEWLEVHGFPASVARDARSTAVAMHAQMQTSLGVASEPAARSAVSLLLSNRLCTVIRAKCLMSDPESARLFIELSATVKSYHE